MYTGWVHNHTTLIYCQLKYNQRFLSVGEKLTAQMLPFVINRQVAVMVGNVKMVIKG